MDLSTKNNKEIVTALPHKEPFLMVDELCHTNEKRTVVALKVREGNLFVDKGFFQEPGLIEHMAQAAALESTLVALREGRDTPFGYLARISNMKIAELPPANSIIETTITNLLVLKTASKVHAVTKSRGMIIANADLLFHIQ